MIIIFYTINTIRVCMKYDNCLCGYTLFLCVCVFLFVFSSVTNSQKSMKYWWYFFLTHPVV